MASALAKHDLEAMLRARQLDNTLAPALSPETFDDQSVVATGLVAIDRRLGGGFPRGHLSEVVGPRSSGRLSLLLATLATVTSLGEAAAFIDPLDMLDPAAAADAGVDLGRLLWIRGAQVSVPAPDSWFRDTRGRRNDEAGDLIERALNRAVKAFNLVLQAGGFGVVALDLGEVPAMAVKRLPFTTWLRLARVIEGSRTACLLVASQLTARSAGGVTVELKRAVRGTRWLGTGARPRLFLGFDLDVRVIQSKWSAGDGQPEPVRLGEGGSLEVSSLRSQDLRPKT